MVHFIPIQVGCYSGYKADEYPKRFYRDDEKFEIEEVTDRWYQGENNPEWPVSNYFKVKVTDCRELIIKHDLRSNRWFLYVKNS
ncbi:MAG: hypothetical protein A2Y71_06895 [Bacteroidetes bacterium RBG_13_42_15]|nr:MAG: hypothetical protein A2Y71_06895 [Bacteroidetes bacterium RBG_13_42_15]